MGAKAGRGRRRGAGRVDSTTGARCWDVPINGTARRWTMTTLLYRSLVLRYPSSELAGLREMNETIAKSGQVWTRLSLAPPPPFPSPSFPSRITEGYSTFNASIKSSKGGRCSVTKPKKTRGEKGRSGKGGDERVRRVDEWLLRRGWSWGVEWRVVGN